MRTYRQGINERRLHVHDFDDVLDSGDRILSAAWTVTSGITTAEEAVTDCTAEIEAYGGTVDTQYLFQVVATTNEGRKHERSFIVMVVDR